MACRKASATRFISVAQPPFDRCYFEQSAIHNTISCYTSKWHMWDVHLPNRWHNTHCRLILVRFYFFDAQLYFLKSTFANSEIMQKKLLIFLIEKFWTQVMQINEISSCFELHNICMSEHLHFFLNYNSSLREV